MLQGGRRPCHVCYRERHAVTALVGAVFNRDMLCPINARKSRLQAAPIRTLASMRGEVTQSVKGCIPARVAWERYILRHPGTRIFGNRLIPRQPPQPAYRAWPLRRPNPQRQGVGSFSLPPMRTALNMASASLMETCSPTHNNSQTSAFSRPRSSPGRPLQ
jgi:hypothetical protein